MKIGVMVDSFRVGLDKGIAKAAAMGAQGLQIYAVSGEISPENLTPSRIREIRRKLGDNGLVVSALCGDLGGHGFARLEENAWRVEKSQRIMDLALELGTTVVTTHIGVVPSNPAHPRWSILQRACEAVGTYGDKVGVRFAIETGPEPADVLLRFIESLDTQSVKVNLDPANLVMVTGTDPVAAVHTLARHIVHTHAKDGVRLRVVDAEVVYDGFAEGTGADSTSLGEPFREVPLGEGSVDFGAYLKALEAVGYDGFLTIEREVGDDPEQDIRKAVDFLKDHLKKLARR